MNIDKDKYLAAKAYTDEIENYLYERILELGPRKFGVGTDIIEARLKRKYEVAFYLGADNKGVVALEDYYDRGHIVSISLDNVLENV
jgi:hypothetical protein